MDKLDLAIIYAVEKHSGSFRKMKNTPYILHPIEAASIAGTMTEDKDVIAAAVLHDTIEDTSATVDEVRKTFGDRICNLLLSDTEDKMRDISAEKSWKIRKQATLDFLENANKEEQIICLSDKLSNMREIYRDYVVLGDKLFLRFNNKDKKEHEWYYRGIGDRLTFLIDTIAYKEYINLLGEVFN